MSDSKNEPLNKGMPKVNAKIEGIEVKRPMTGVAGQKTSIVNAPAMPVAKVPVPPKPSAMTGKMNNMGNAAPKSPTPLQKAETDPLQSKVQEFQSQKAHYDANIPKPRNAQAILSPEHEKALTHYVTNHPYSKYNWNPNGQHREVDHIRYQQWKETKPQLKTYDERQAAYKQELGQMGNQPMAKADTTNWLPKVTSDQVIKPKAPREGGTLDYSTFNKPMYSQSGQNKPTHQPVQHSKGYMDTKGTVMMKADKNDPKFESCVMDVKAQNKAEGKSVEQKNPWAICHASLGKTENECTGSEYVVKDECLPYEKLAKLRKCMASKMNKADAAGNNPMPVHMRD